MKKICLEMPGVTKCMASECVYNLNSNCHARHYYRRLPPTRL